MQLRRCDDEGLRLVEGRSVRDLPAKISTFDDGNASPGISSGAAAVRTRLIPIRSGARTSGPVRVCAAMSRGPVAYTESRCRYAIGLGSCGQRKLGRNHEHLTRLCNFDISIFASLTFCILLRSARPSLGANSEVASKKIYLIFAKRGAARRRRPAHTCLLRQNICAVDVTVLRSRDTMHTDFPSPLSISRPTRPALFRVSHACPLVY